MFPLLLYIFFVERDKQKLLKFKKEEKKLRSAMNYIMKKLRG
jgi:hypothetical protein